MFRPPLGRLLVGLCAPALGASNVHALDATAAPETITVTGTARPVATSPQTLETIAADRIAETINALDTEDAVKYMPSLFVRKRNYGDTQPVLATRTWGVNSSARSLVYADDTLLTALVANNNTIGAPRWGLVTPEEIARVDVLYGPFAAEYPGNSMGAVLRITTRDPQGFEASAKQVEAFQDFSAYGTADTYRTDQSSAALGWRFGDLSLRLSGQHAHSQAQPLSFATTASAPSGVSGLYLDRNKLGQTANVAGATGILETDMDNVKVKAAYDLSDRLRAAYVFGLWQNDGAAHVQTYLRDASGAPTFGGIAGFASGTYQIQERHSSHAASLDYRGSDVDLGLAASHYRFDEDNQETPQGVTTGTGLTSAGRQASYTGTYWTNLDARLTWRGPGAAPRPAAGPTPVGNAVSLGFHQDWYKLNNPTYNLTNWTAGAAAERTGLYSFGGGMTRTAGLWAQDAWTFHPGWTATLGARWEWWSADQGYNYQSLATGAVATNQPKVSRMGVSPKATLAWEPAADWTVKASFGKAYRFPTVAELYQLVSTGATYTSPNPNLAPERVMSGELSAERATASGSVRLSLFEETVRDALIAQTSGLTTANGSIAAVSYVQNVGEIRNRGVEVAAERRDLLLTGFDLGGSVTYVDSAILRDEGVRSSLDATRIVDVRGKRAPYVPDWRATVTATYRPDAAWAFSLGARYSGQVFSTLDNADRVANVYQSFNGFFVVDARARYAITEGVEAAIGVDNLGNERYWLFHPFPQRTIVAEIRMTL